MIHMNLQEGQIVKVRQDIQNKKSELYGIAIDNTRILTEDSTIVDVSAGSVGQIFFGRTGLYQCYEFGGAKSGAKIEVESGVEVSAEITNLLELMKERYERADDLSIQWKKLTERIDSDVKSMCELGNKIYQLKGVIGEEEFLDEFENNLTSEFKEQLNPKSYKEKILVDLYPNDEWRTKETYMEIKHFVVIDTWYTKENEILQPMWRDCPTFKKGAEKTELWKKYIEENTRRLPAKGCDIEETLALYMGSLTYVCKYTIPMEDYRPLTKEYAKELANKFCGEDKEQVKESNEWESR